MSMMEAIKALKDSIYEVHRRQTWIQEDCKIDNNAYSMADWCWHETLKMDKDLAEIERYVMKKSRRKN